MTIAHAAHGFVSTLAVGTVGAGMTVALFTAGEVGTIVGLVLAAIMTILTFRSNASAAAAREQATSAREATAAALLAAREDREEARKDRAAAALIAKEAAEAAAAHAIALEKIRTSVDGVASRKDDEVSALKAIVGDLHAQLAKEESRASTLAATHAAVAVATASGSTVGGSGSTANGHLEGIDNNTHQIEKNTARTEVLVKDTNAIVHGKDQT